MAATHKRAGVRALATALLASATCAAALPVAAAGRDGAGSSPGAVVPQTLLDAARANPDTVFQVIVEARGDNGQDAAKQVDSAREHAPGHAFGVTRRLDLIGGAAAQVTGTQLLQLAADNKVVSITRDLPLAASGNGIGSGGGKKDGSRATSTAPTPSPMTSTTTTCSVCPYEGVNWPYITGVTGFWPKENSRTSLQAPTIAIVDSGIDASNPFFGGRVIKQVTFSSAGTNSPGDGYGHGTYVAGIASGMYGNVWGGAAPASKLVSLDVLNDNGMALTSDVIAAADWIYQNKAAYNIRVANFSLHSVRKSSFLTDPLDQAVEKLWLSGVVVVAAVGNYAQDGQPSGVPYAPANDPFVLTVGALDVNGTPQLSDDVPAPWSAYGYTNDGFAKPELGAPGRFMIGAVPPTATMPVQHPERVIAPGFMRMSGTSFAAPVAAGAAADLLTLHPAWSPDQVKGALMVSAKPITPSAATLSSGVGELKLDAATLVTAPPNPNAALDRFLIKDSNGGPTPVFDGRSWTATVSVNPLWDAASWGDASWGSGDASWGEASWSDASWGEGDASWGDSSTADASDGAAAWASLAWVN